jgi:hypothetical protein
VVSVGHRLQGEARVTTVETRPWDGITAPVDSNVPLCQGVDNDRYRDGDGGAEGSGGDAKSLSAQNSQSGVGEVTH